MVMTRRRLVAPLAVIGAVGLALTGCSGGPGSSNNNTGDGDGNGGDDNVVTIYGTIADTEAELLEQSWADWEEENDIDIQYESSKEFEAQIAVRAQGGNAPDLAIFPQPGLMADIANLGYLKPAPEEVAANVAEGWSVIVKGQAQVLKTDDEIRDAERAELFPWTATQKDHYIRVAPSEITVRHFNFGPQPDSYLPFG